MQNVYKQKQVVWKDESCSSAAACWPYTEDCWAMTMLWSIWQFADTLSSSKTGLEILNISLETVATAFAV